MRRFAELSEHSMVDVASTVLSDAVFQVRVRVMLSLGLRAHVFTIIKSHAYTHTYKQCTHVHIQT